MSNLSQTYILHDHDETLKAAGAKRINIRDAEYYNKLGYGIHQTLNYFRNARRKANLVSINAWAIDIDTGTKEEQMRKIKSGLIPTMVVETARGYHAYWKAKNANPNNWKAIVWDRIVPYYGSDENAKDICRMLRKPGYYHMKDPANPFLVKKVWEVKVEYSEQEMIGFYPDLKSEAKNKKELNKVKKDLPMKGSFWDNVWNLNCEYALDKLSGSSIVGGEVYTFRNTTGDKKNILVNGKTSSCWVDRDGRIGSLSGGGPMIYHWLRWFGVEPKTCVEIIEREFPECKDKNNQLELLI